MSMRAVKMTCVSDTSLDFSVASKWLDDIGETEINIHGKLSQGNAYEKDMVSSPPWGSGEGAVTSLQGVSAREPPGYLKASQWLPSSLYWVCRGLHWEWKTSMRPRQTKFQKRGILQDSTVSAAGQALWSLPSIPGRTWRENLLRRSLNRMW